MAARAWTVAAMLGAGGLSVLIACSSPPPRDEIAPSTDGHANGSVGAAPSAHDRADARSADAFAAAYSVLASPRCVNCHPRGDRPLQGDDSHVHAQNVQRGSDGHGLYAEKCDACHQESNVAGAHMPPGAHGWHLASKESPLVFQGVNAHDLCRQLIDPKQNGGQSIAQVIDHVEHAPLVLWAWSPGEGRTQPPLSHAEFVRLMRAWADGGCKCPE